jgi:hypothetical protein
VNGTDATIVPQPTLSQAVGDAWTRHWFASAGPRPLAVIRILAGGLALVLWTSYAADLEAWFGPQGVLSADVVRQWRSPFAVSIFDAATTPATLRTLHWIGAGMLAAVTVGLATPVTTVLAAVFFASLLHRGPMLAGPADDVVAVILWCLAIGRSGDALSIDRLIAARLGCPAPAASLRTNIALGLLRLHASVIAAAALLAQLKGDVWWDGTAAWWLAARIDSRLIDTTGPLARSEYLTNLVTHAITLFEAAFAAGVWFVPLRRILVPVSFVAWPLIGILVGEPCFGLAMAVLAVSFLGDKERRTAWKP